MFDFFWGEFITLLLGLSKDSRWQSERHEKLKHADSSIVGDEAILSGFRQLEALKAIQ